MNQNKHFTTFWKYWLETDSSLYFCIFLVYILFPSHNSTIDAYCYAADIKWETHFFQPHHLLYNCFAWLFCTLFSFSGLETLALLKIFNSLFATLCLVTFGKILNQQSISKKGIRNITLFCAFSFGIWRFAVENEVYIVPIFFSLVASYCFGVFLEKKRNTVLLISGCFAAIACLFHQIHVFWWLGLLIGILVFKRSWLSCWFYAIPALIVPIIYSLVVYYQNKGYITFGILFQFVFHDYFQGSATTEFGLQNILLAFVSFFRTFFQVHGIMLFLLQKYGLFFIPLFIIIVLFSINCILFLKTKKLIFTLKNTKKEKYPFQNTHLLIALFQFAFATYSVGNSEFMVMIPFLLFIGFGNRLNFEHKIFVYSILLLFTWNFSFAIFPKYFFNFYNNEKLCSKIKEIPYNIYILKDKNLIENILYYETGKEYWENLIKSPSEQSVDMPTYKKFIYNKLNKQNKIYTDIPNKPIFFNRAKFLKNNGDEIFFRNFKLIKADSIICDLGTTNLFEIQKRY